MIVQIVCTFYATFVLTNMGCVYGWGTFRDIHGSKAFTDGVETTCHSEVVYDARPRNPVVKIAAGANHIVAVLKVNLDQANKCGTYGVLVLQSGQVLSWGSGDLGQLGRPPQTSIRGDAPKTPVEGLTPAAMVFQEKTVIVDAFCTDFCTFLKDTSGRIFACGLNDCGQLAIHPEELSIDKLADAKERIRANIVVTQPTEVEVLTALKLRKIVGGKDHCLGLTEEGAVYSWGSSEHGVLGRRDAMSTMAGGSILPDPQPVDRFQGREMIDIAAGYVSSCRLYLSASRPSLLCRLPLEPSTATEACSPGAETPSIVWDTQSAKTIKNHSPEK